MKKMKRIISEQTKSDDRDALLDVLRTEVNRRGGTLRLRSDIRVTADDCGIDVPVDIRRITRLYPGAPEQSRCFDIGGGFCTDHLDDAALRTIVRSIKP